MKILWVAVFRNSGVWHVGWWNSITWPSISKQMDWRFSLFYNFSKNYAAGSLGEVT